MWKTKGLESGGVVGIVAVAVVQVVQVVALFVIRLLLNWQLAMLKLKKKWAKAAVLRVMWRRRKGVNRLMRTLMKWVPMKRVVMVPELEKGRPALSKTVAEVWAEVVLVVMIKQKKVLAVVVTNEIAAAVGALSVMMLVVVLLLVLLAVLTQTN